MKGTPMDGSIKRLADKLCWIFLYRVGSGHRMSPRICVSTIGMIRLFEGEMENYIECLDVAWFHEWGLHKQINASNLAAGRAAKLRLSTSA